MDPIHLVCAADARYGAYAGIMLSSVLRTNPGQPFAIHLLSNDVARADLRKLRQLARQAGSRLAVYDVARQMEDYADPNRYHLNRMTYARLLSADLLPADINRVIYLDCDMICTGSLRPLWELAQSVPVLGAVPDRAGDGWKAALGLPADARYFNSGMLLVNLEAWRAQGVARRIIEWIGDRAGELKLADQDAINVCLCRDITPLPECWNLQIGKDSGPLPAERLADGVLLHYTSIPKPWVFRFRGLGAEIFVAAKRASPWRFKPPTFRLVHRLRKALDKRLDRLWPASSGAATL